MSGRFIRQTFAWMLSMIETWTARLVRVGVLCLVVVFTLSCQVLGMESTDTYTAGASGWMTQGSWTLVEQADGQVVFRGDGNGDVFARHRSLRLGASWRIEVDVRFRRYYVDGNNRALAAFALFPSLDSGVQLEANLGHRTNNSVQFDTQWFNPVSATWHNVLQTVWTPNTSSTYRMHLYRAPGSDRLIFKVVGTNGTQFMAQSSPFPMEVLNRMQVPGLRVNSGQIEFDNFRWISPYTPPAPPEIRIQPQGKSVLTGTEYSLSVEASDSVPLSYQWFKGSAPLIGATNASYSLGRTYPYHTGTYSVQVSNGESLSMSQPAAIQVTDAWLRLTAPTQSSGMVGDGFPIVVRAPAGTTYRIQRSLDLSTWTQLKQSTGTGLPEELSLPVSEGDQLVFLRLVLP